LCFYIFISYLFSSVLNNHDLPLKLLAKAPRARHKHLLTAYLARSMLLDLPQAPFSINLARGDRLYGEQERPWPDD